MPEVIIKYKSAKALKALQDLTKLFDIVIEKPVNEKNINDLPITFAKKPDVTALAGIWEGKDIKIEELRKRPGGTGFEFGNFAAFVDIVTTDDNIKQGQVKMRGFLIVSTFLFLTSCYSSKLITKHRVDNSIREDIDTLVLRKFIANTFIFNSDTKFYSKIHGVDTITFSAEAPSESFVLTIKKHNHQEIFNISQKKRHILDFSREHIYNPFYSEFYYYNHDGLLKYQYSLRKFFNNSPNKKDLQLLYIYNTEYKTFDKDGKPVMVFNYNNNFLFKIKDVIKIYNTKIKEKLSDIQLLYYDSKQETKYDVRKSPYSLIKLDHPYYWCGSVIDQKSYSRIIDGNTGEILTKDEIHIQTSY